MSKFKKGDKVIFTTYTKNKDSVTLNPIKHKTGIFVKNHPIYNSDIIVRFDDIEYTFFRSMLEKVKPIYKRRERNV